MLSYNKKRFKSSGVWLRQLKDDDMWLNYRKKMIVTFGECKDKPEKGEKIREHYTHEVLEFIGDGMVRHYWEIRLHNIEDTINDLWMADEITLAKLTTCAIGMLAMEWIETQSSKLLGVDNTTFHKPADDEWDLDCSKVIVDAGLAKLKEAAAAGLITYEGRGLLKPAASVSATLLAYLCGRIFAGDYPKPLPHSKDTMTWEFGGRMLGANELDELFGSVAIGGTRRNNKGKQLPTGHERVDKLFEKDDK